jgi:hypothetical protein
MDEQARAVSLTWGMESGRSSCRIDSLGVGRPSSTTRGEFDGRRGHDSGKRVTVRLMASGLSVAVANFYAQSELYLLTKSRGRGRHFANNEGDARHDDAIQSISRLGRDAWESGMLSWGITTVFSSLLLFCLQPMSLHRQTCHHLFPRLLLISTSSSDNPLSTSSSCIVPYPDLLPNDAPSPASSPPPPCRRSSSPSDPVPSSASSFPAAAASR